jgi:hypothetical protein
MSRTLLNAAQSLKGNQFSSKQLLNLSHTFSPGVGDYDIDKVEFRDKSPICTIGNGRRFEDIASIQRYKLNMPASYVNGFDDHTAPKPKLGIFGKTSRFRKFDESRPGPGFYET